MEGEPMSNKSIKAELLRLLGMARDLEIKWIANLNPAQRDEPGTWEKWSARDNLAHIGDWRQFTAITMRKIKAGETPEPREDFEHYNRVIFDNTHTWGWEAVQALAEKSHRELTAAVEHFSEADLTEEKRFEWRKGQPLIKTLSSYFVHSYMHVAYFLADEGDFAEAERLQEEQCREECGLDDSAEGRGAAVYNFACFYARSGKGKEALQQLEKAFALRPSLKEWAPKDSDLVSLHNEAGFLKLVA